jgi:hypothetical protein
VRKSNTLSVATVVALSMTGLGVSSAGASPIGLDGTDGPSSIHNKLDFSKDATAKRLYKRIIQRLPSDWKQRQATAFQKLRIERQPQQKMAMTKIKRMGIDRLAGKRAIDPNDYECAPTKFDAWVDGILKDVNPTTMYYLQQMGALDIPTYDAILYGKTTDGNHNLDATDGPELKTSFTKLQGFWDVNLKDIQLMGMDRNIFSSTTRMARTIKYVYGTTTADATAIAKDIQNLIKSESLLKGGKHPIFTLNAFAFSAEGQTDPVVGAIPDKTVFGDGILVGLRATGFGDVGPEAVMSHEMAHHVQYENNTFATNPPGPEGTRRTELMADAFGTYAGAHKKGLSKPTNEIEKWANSFYEVGDCSFDDPGHHGTPNQRKASSAWGAAQYKNQTNKDLKQPSLALQAKFDAALPVLTKPDAATNVRAYLTKVGRAA